MIPRSRQILAKRAGPLALFTPRPYGFYGSPRLKPFAQTRSVSDIPQFDQRSRLSRLWAPSGGIAPSANEDAHSKLVRAGFLRQAHSGIFHMLPLGLRVQDKVEKLIDRHMASVGASKLDLSSISSEELWTASGRLNAANAELFRFKDRKGGGYLLSPTHEEEITALVAKTVRSHKELPTRLYQISRKYRDELRPRHGLLRGREFIMKDLYTFDASLNLALATYEEIRAAYVRLFDELKVAYLVAEADSGDMGGDLSHEFHFPTSKGEDHVISCGSCDYVANEELAESALRPATFDQDSAWTFVGADQEDGVGKNTFTVWRGLSRDRNTLINVWYSPRGLQGGEVNTHAVKAIIPDLDPGIENAALLWAQTMEKSILEGGLTELPKIINLVDYRLPSSVAESVKSGVVDPLWASTAEPSSFGITSSTLIESPSDGQPLNLLRITEGDACPRCEHGSLKVEKAIELGHTFFLGTRYSEPLKALVTLPAGYQDAEPSKKEADGSAQAVAPLSAAVQVPMQMGCHGIGVSRLIGAVAETLADEKGLNWPRVIAPYEAIIVPTRGLEQEAVEVYDALASGESRQQSIDAVLDDRSNSFPWKMQDADLVGYPIIVVVGRGWKENKTCEVQCRRLGVKKSVPLEKLAGEVQELLVQL